VVADQRGGKHDGKEATHDGSRAEPRIAENRPHHVQALGLYDKK